MGIGLHRENSSSAELGNKRKRREDYVRASSMLPFAPGVRNPEEREGWPNNLTYLENSIKIILLLFYKTKITLEFINLCIRNVTEQKILGL